MTTRDDDILDFDFVDEGATTESPGHDAGAAPRRPAPAGTDGGGPRGPRLRLRSGWTPLLRLVGLIAFAILVVVLLVVWAQGCASDRQRESYDDYMTGLKAVGDESATIGRELSELLTTPGLQQTDLETQLAGLVQRQQLGVENALDLDPPGPVRPEHESALEALRFRVSGLQGLLDTFVATKTSDDRTAAGQQLAAQAQRLTTSDVVWNDLFRVPATAVLQDRDITGVAVPASVFVENTELYTTRSMTQTWQRIHGASTGGTPVGIHGNGIESVTVQPSGQQLSTDTETTIQSSTDLAFEVAVTNSGDFQEVGVKVTLTIPKADRPIVKNATIPLIESGETQTVTFRDFPDPPFGEGVAVKVDVQPVEGETNTSNNTVEYPVIFSLG
ncbi:MAG TPA: CARDB domain-containing protein [Gaiellaceae bacterium]|nr:CARDB domain-containing protein [Gaiellaceae bacterium]